jgi:hypothetical protein
MFKKVWITIYKPETDTIITESKYYMTVLGARRAASRFVDYLRPGYVVAIRDKEKVIENYFKKVKKV